MSDVVSTVKNDLTWLQKHERLIIWTMVLLAGMFLGNKYLNNSAASSQVKAALLEQKASDDQKQNAALASQNAQIVAQYQSMLDSLSRQNATLASAVAQRNSDLAKQQAVNTNAPLPDVAKRWAELANVQPVDITVSDSGLLVDDIAARQTVNLLEEVPVLQQNVKDVQQVADNKQAELDQANRVIDGKDKQIAGLDQQLTDEQTAHKADVRALKAEARKSKRNWFIAGFISGFIAKIAVH